MEVGSNFHKFNASSSYQTHRMFSSEDVWPAPQKKTSCWHLWTVCFAVSVLCFSDCRYRMWSVFDWKSVRLEMFERRGVCWWVKADGSTDVFGLNHWWWQGSSVSWWLLLTARWESLGGTQQVLQKTLCHCLLKPMLLDLWPLSSNWSTGHVLIRVKVFDQGYGKIVVTIKESVDHSRRGNNTCSLSPQLPCCSTAGCATLEITE